MSPHSIKSYNLTNSVNTSIRASRPVDTYFGLGNFFKGAFKLSLHSASFGLNLIP
jgi:hypothetical protein